MRLPDDYVKNDFLSHKVDYRYAAVYLAYEDHSGLVTALEFVYKNDRLCTLQPNERVQFYFFADYFFDTSDWDSAYDRCLI